MVIRPAKKTEASDLAVLIDIASHGITSWVWDGMRADEASLFEVGRKRAMRDEGSFSYRNAFVADVDGAPAGMIVGYLLDDPYDLSGLADVPEEFRPLLELEAQAPGSWYVNVLAVFEEHRGKGYGEALLAKGEQLARDCGAGQMSIIIEDTNIGARKLYERLGFKEHASCDAVPIPVPQLTCKAWILLVKELKK